VSNVLIWCHQGEGGDFEAKGANVLEKGEELMREVLAITVRNWNEEVSSGVELGRKWQRRIYSRSVEGGRKNERKKNRESLFSLFG